MKFGGFLQKIFSLISQIPGWFYFLPPHRCPLLAPWFQRALGSASFQCICLCTLANTPQIITAYAIVFLKPFFQWDPKIPLQPHFWENGKNFCNAGQQDGWDMGAYIISMSEGTCATPLSGLHIPHKPLLTAQPGHLRDSNSCWEASVDVFL